jgi:hypothetical protein
MSEDQPQDHSLTVPENKLEPVIKDLPPPKQQEIKEIVREIQRNSTLAYIEHGAPRIDPETARILTESVNRDNDHKFDYLTQKQRNEADAELRRDTLEAQRHTDRVKLLWPILGTSLVICLSAFGFGLYFCATGHETIGSSILTGLFSGVFGYLGGLGTAQFFKTK